MKKILFIMLLSFIGLVTLTSVKSLNISGTVSPTITSDFCQGWEEGYCEGWRDVKGSYAPCPVTPVCPVAPVGKDTYNGGYNLGFKAGSKAANR